ncbi:DMT family transporter [Sneathiella chinensis]|uniref:DMT transporter permease n=1 Tax=Sneathiella chinensis TaxID=349750 RepID=A0ABQ5U5G2_9PROT|nr:DMT family transporter [Sneathiella chinensis]GLQ07006.1 DMT transporter permease [Sneathiella chinensis]
MSASANTQPLASSYRGIFLYCTAVFLFVVMDSFAKYAATIYSPLQVVWARYAFHMLLMVLILGPTLRGKLVRTANLKLQVFRSMLLLGATICFFTALKYIPLADAGAMGSTAPLFVTVMSVLFLGEKVSFRRWTAVLVGFAGALIILRPGMSAVHPAMFLVLGMAVFYSSYQITTRKLAGVDPALTTLFYTALVGTVAMSFVLPSVWITPPDLEGWLLLGVIGLIGGVSHFIIILAFSYSTASNVAPFSYTQLIWTAVFGFAIFGDFPDGYTILGAIIIVGSGLYILYRERVRHSH